MVRSDSSVAGEVKIGGDIPSKIGYRRFDILLTLVTLCTYDSSPTTEYQLFGTKSGTDCQGAWKERTG